MRKRNSIFITGILTLIVFFGITLIIGCGGGGSGGDGTSTVTPTESPTVSPTTSPTTTPSPSPTQSDEEQIRQSISQNSNGIFGFEEDEEESEDIEREDVEAHQWWRRLYTSRDDVVDVDVQGDVAYVTVTRHWQGTFYVKPGGSGQFVQKTLDDTMTRTATYEKSVVVNGKETWELKRLSPLVLQPYSGDKVVNIKSMRITNMDTGEEIMYITDPTHEFELSEYPIFEPDTNVKVEAEVEHLGTSEFVPPMHVFIHHGTRLIYRHFRNIAYDDGGENQYSGDETAGDNIYTRLYKTGHPSFQFWKRGAADVLDSRCLHTSDDDYSSNAWIIPYKVQSGTPPSPTPTPTESPEPTPSPTESPEPTPTPTESPEPTPSPTE